MLKVNIRDRLVDLDDCRTRDNFRFVESATGFRFSLLDFQQSMAMRYGFGQDKTVEQMVRCLRAELARAVDVPRA